MAERAYLGAALRRGRDLMARALDEHAKPLSQFPEHMDLTRQHDLVTRYRVAVRLFLARCYRWEARGRPDCAVLAAEQAGKYFGEYRQHYRHLRSLPGFRPSPTYG